MVVVLAGVSIPFAVAVLADWTRSESLGLVAYFLGWFVFLPALLLLVPVLLLVVVVDRVSRWQLGGERIALSWDVRPDGAEMGAEVHVVSLPESTWRAPDHLWIDGRRVALQWVPTGAFTGTTSRARVDDVTLRGTLSAGIDAKEAGADVAIGVAAAVLGAGVGSGPAVRYRLEVEGATIEDVPVDDGDRKPSRGADLGAA